MPLRRRAVFVFSSMAIAAWAEPAGAGPLRPFFEPTDLEFENPGVLDIDVQTGPTYGRNAWGYRWLLTDLEVDLGIYDNVELDLDATYSSDLQLDASRKIGSEALWPTVKLGLLDFQVKKHAFAVGLQLGPRIPMFTGMGLGYAALGLAGWSYGHVHLVLNNGFVMDPGTTITEGHPAGAVFGLDVALDLDDDGHFKLTAELGASASFNSRGEAHQTIGLAWEPYTDRLQFSVVLLTGIAANGDRGSLLFGVSPKLDLF